MTAVWFVDTSVWCNLLEIPHKSQSVAKTRKDLAAKARHQDQLILPFASVVETGNFVAQVKDGHQRRRIATQFSGMLADTARGKAPWVPNALSWNGPFLEQLVAGLGENRTLVDLAQQRIGLGDLSIMIEMAQYRQRTCLENVQVWTYDHALAAYSQT